MEITYETSEYILNAIMFTLRELHPEQDQDYLEEIASGMFIDYCDSMGIENISDPHDLRAIVAIFFER